MGSTHIYDDVQGFIIGKENTHTPTVLHDSVVMEVQFVHCVWARSWSGLGSESSAIPLVPSTPKPNSTPHHTSYRSRSIPMFHQVGFIAVKKPNGRLWTEVVTLVRADGETSTSTTADAGTGTACLEARAA